VGKEKTPIYSCWVLFPEFQGENFHTCMLPFLPFDQQVGLVLVAELPFCAMWLQKLLIFLGGGHVNLPWHAGHFWGIFTPRMHLSVYIAVMAK